MDHIDNFSPCVVRKMRVFSHKSDSSFGKEEVFLIQLNGISKIVQRVANINIHLLTFVETNDAYYSSLCHNG